MLQQTRVETVKPYFERFLVRFPTPLALADATEDEVLSSWSGLGYYRRARMLHAGAKQAAKDDGAMPLNRDALLALPGIGRYTAGAIASIAYGEAVSLVDGNVARVLARVFAIEEDIKKEGMRRAESLAEELVHAKDPGAWNQALMELGAMICTPRSPSCEKCPIAASCEAHRTKRQNELPLVSAKTKPTLQRIQALVATSSKKSATASRVLLARRKSEGLFGGLWEPPLIEGTKPKTLFDRFALTSIEERVAKVTHVLSHRKLVVDVHHASLTSSSIDTSKLPDVYEAADLFTPAAIEKLGIATFARKILSSI